MSTNHFNNLTEEEQQRLAILIEECGEVIQAASKILRHGYESRNPTIANSATNREALARELGDLQFSIQQMADNCDFEMHLMLERQFDKVDLIKPYLHHQEEFPQSDKTA